MIVTPKETHPPPYAHQDAAVKFCLERRNSYLSMDMGSGKSRCLIDFAEEVNAPLTLVITTKRAVMHVWPGQYKSWATQDIEVITMFGGTVATRIKKAEIKLKCARHTSRHPYVDYDANPPGPNGKGGLRTIALVCNWE
ncbi:MAG: DEAD/DEAH box helicase family protein, partial [Planctomycetota bacterium]|nr:DEAD/DEAH box helicase family protein [Planctomycetota bacterium]